MTLFYMKKHALTCVLSFMGIIYHSLSHLGTWVHLKKPEDLRTTAYLQSTKGQRPLTVKQPFGVVFY